MPKISQSGRAARRVSGITIDPGCRILLSRVDDSPAAPDAVLLAIEKVRGAVGRAVPKTSLVLLASSSAFARRMRRPQQGL